MQISNVTNCIELKMSAPTLEAVMEEVVELVEEVLLGAKSTEGYLLVFFLLFFSLAGF